jgi:hypothetical protein
MPLQNAESNASAPMQIDVFHKIEPEHRTADRLPSGRG